LSDENGDVYFETTTNKPYTLTATHSDYFDFTQSGINSYDFTIYMKRKGGGSSGTSTTLVVDVKDGLGNAIGGALIGATDMTTGQSKSVMTGDDGVGVITQMFASNNLLVSVVVEDYAESRQTTTIRSGETKYISIVLSQETRGNQFSVSGRGCADLIKGVWLCGDLRTDGTSNICTANADCISGKCNTYAQECSRFNYTLCDAGGKYAGIGRGNTCVYKATIFGFLDSAAGNILEYFLYFMVIIIILVLIVMIRKKK
jgi:hypothetical protein